MLEILFLWNLAKRIGVILREKGRKPLPFQVMLVLLWFCGEIAGGAVGAIVFDNPAGGFNGMMYLFALLGAAAGATVTFVIVKNLQPIGAQFGARGFPVSTYSDEI